MTGASLLMFPHGLFPKDEKLEGTTRSWQTAAFFSPSPRSIYQHNDKSSEVDAELELSIMSAHFVNHGQTDKASKLKQLSCPEVTLGPSCSSVPAHSIGFFSPSSLQHAANLHKDMPLPADKQISASDNTDKLLVTALRSVSEEADYTSSCEVRKGGELPSVQFLEDEGPWQQDQRAGSDVDDDGPRSAVLEQAKLPSSQYKGVVPQPNGRWGAQIYEKHQRVWLGTFNMEEDAAKAYDRAALKFRGRDAMTNFKHAGEEEIETVFLDRHTKEQVVDMLRRHTYDEELDQYRKLAAAMADDARSLGMVIASGGRYGDGFCKEAATKPISITMERSIQRELLFEKAVTPSDVGKLNRLVIPKQHAERCFPLNGDGSEKGLLLNFEDSAGKMWRFRYSYWNSSQSYVLTKGWSRFVKEMKLDAGDIVVFEKGSSNEEHFYISCRKRPSAQRALLDATLLQQQPSFLNLRPMSSSSSSSSPYNTIAAAARFSPQWRHPNHRPSWLIHEEMNPGSAVNTVLFPHPNPSPAPSWIHDRTSIQQEPFVNMRAGFSKAEASDQHTSVEGTGFAVTKVEASDQHTSVERPGFAVTRVEASDQHTAMRSSASVVSAEARRNKIHGVRLFGVNLSPFQGGGEEPTTMEEWKTNSSSMLSCSEAAYGCKDLKRKGNVESSDDSNSNKSSKRFRDGQD